MNAVAKIGPVAVNVDASNWWFYDKGIFNGCNQTSPDVNHVVVVVGYGEEVSATTAAGGKDGRVAKYWIIRNSWSPTWGEAGYMRLLRTDNDDTTCGTDVAPQDGVACDGQTQPVKVCGTCGVIYDAAYPLNAVVL